MEEFKNLKEIIELSEEEINNNDENVSAVLDLVDLKELRNLLARNKELKEGKKELQKYIKDYLIPKSTINLVYIPKSKIKEILAKYRYIEIGDMDKIIEFYKGLQELLEDFEETGNHIPRID